MLPCTPRRPRYGQPARQSIAGAAGSWLAALLLCCAAASGCVERRFVISSDPPGAIVYDEKGLPISATPADRPFTYYGKYRFTLVKDGYETLAAEENVDAPWYQYMFLDFISENLIPYRFRDIRRLHFQMQPLQPVSAETLLNSANTMRQFGQTLGPSTPAGVTGGVLTPPFMPGVP